MSTFASVTLKAFALLFVVGLFLAMIVIFSMALAGLFMLCIMGLGCLFPTLPTPTSTNLFVIATALNVIFFSYRVCKEKDKLEKART